MLACKPGDRSHTQERTKLQLAVRMFEGNFTTEQYNTLIHTANAWPRVVAGVGGTQDVLALVEAAALRGNPEADRAAQARISEARAAEKRDTHIELLNGFATYDWTRDRTHDIWLAEPRAAAAGVIDQMTREVATQRTVAALGRAALVPLGWAIEGHAVLQKIAEQESERRRRRRRRRRGCLLSSMCSGPYDTTLTQFYLNNIYGTQVNIPLCQFVLVLVRLFFYE